MSSTDGRTLFYPPGGPGTTTEGHTTPSRRTLGCHTTRHGPYKGEDKGLLGGGVGFATVPLDRFVSVGASYDGGEIRTKPLRLRGSDLHINAKSDFGEIVVEVLDEKGNRIAKSKAIRRDNLDAVVD